MEIFLIYLTLVLYSVFLPNLDKIHINFHKLLKQFFCIIKIETKEKEKLQNKADFLKKERLSELEFLAKS